MMHLRIVALLIEVSADCGRIIVVACCVRMHAIRYILMMHPVAVVVVRLQRCHIIGHRICIVPIPIVMQVIVVVMMCVVIIGIWWKFWVDG